MWYIHSVLEYFLRINLDKSDSFFVIRNLFEFHNFIVVINGFFIEVMRQEIYDVFVNVFNVKYIGELQIEYVSVLFLNGKLFIHQKYFIMLFIAYCWIVLFELILKGIVTFKLFFSILYYHLSVFFDYPAAHSPSIDLVCNLFLLHKF